MSKKKDFFFYSCIPPSSYGGEAAESSPSSPNFAPLFSVDGFVILEQPPRTFLRFFGHYTLLPTFFLSLYMVSLRRMGDLMSDYLRCRCLITCNRIKTVGDRKLVHHAVCLHIHKTRVRGLSEMETDKYMQCVMDDHFYV